MRRKYSPTVVGRIPLSRFRSGVIGAPAIQREISGGMSSFSNLDASDANEGVTPSSTSAEGTSRNSRKCVGEIPYPPVVEVRGKERMAAEISSVGNGATEV